MCNYSRALLTSNRDDDEEEKANRLELFEKAAEDPPMREVFKFWESQKQ